MYATYTANLLATLIFAGILSIYFLWLSGDRIFFTSWATRSKFLAEGGRIKAKMTSMRRGGNSTLIAMLVAENGQERAWSIGISIASATATEIPIDQAEKRQFFQLLGDFIRAFFIKRPEHGFVISVKRHVFKYKISGKLKDKFFFSA